MVAYLIRRILLAIPTLIGAATVSFLLLRVLPGNPADLIAGPYASPQVIANIHRQLGLDRSLFSQYLSFLDDLIHGNLGTSYVSQTPVLHEIMTAAPKTALLAVLSIAFASVVGCALGIWAAVKRSSRTDIVLSASALVGTSIPIYWLSLLAINLFAVRLRWLPVAGAGGLSSYVLPTLMLTLFNLGFIMRQSRSAVLTEIAQDYVRTARAKGAPTWRVLIVHVLRNALLPILTIIGLQFGQLLGGAILVESIFAWPGIGQLLFHAIEARDFAMVQGIVFCFAIAVIVVNILTDLSYSYVDPRLRVS
jgi:peptide/nickel transport system permease protein